MKDSYDFLFLKFMYYQIDNMVYDVYKLKMEGLYHF